MIDEVGTIWIVEKPRSSGDVIEDILYEDDISGLLQRARGGLISFHIYGIYKSKLAAERTAIKLIKSKIHYKLSFFLKLLLSIPVKFLINFNGFCLIDNFNNIPKL